MGKIVFYLSFIMLFAWAAHSQTVTDSTIFQYKKAEFEGGASDFYKFMISKMVLLRDYRRGNSEITKASFILTKEGTLDSLKIDSLGSSDIINHNILSALKNSKGMWIASELAGEKINSVVSVYGKINYEKDKYDRDKYPTMTFYYISIPAIDISTFYYNLGVKNAEDSNYDQAIVCFSAVLKLNADDIDALYNRGIMYRKKKNDADACKDWNKIKDLGKSDADNLLEKFCK